MELKDKQIEVKGNGIKVHVLSGIFIVIGVIIMVTSIFIIKRIYDKYDETREAYQHTEMKREAVIKFLTASDYLTDQVRMYVATGEEKYAENYLNEKDNLKNRETAIATIEESYSHELEKELLNDAMEKSELLVEYELKAIELVKASNMVEAAEQLYSTEYEDNKERIAWDIKNAIVLIEEESGARYRENEDDLIVALNVATLLLFLLFILLVLIFIFVVLLVVRPADKFLLALDHKEKLPEIGCYEFRVFAKKYNYIYRSDKKNQALLKEQGEIDELTGMLKVGTLDLVRHNLTDSKEPLGIMLVDIDNFRLVKESHGYDIADKLVSKVAGLFIASFKSSDYIIRISEDEFELFLLRMEEKDGDMLVERIAQINQQLQIEEDGLPAVSVSVGVAFSDNGYTKETERNADKALNEVKNNGRGKCKVFG